MKVSFKKNSIVYFNVNIIQVRNPNKKNTLKNIRTPSFNVHVSSLTTVLFNVEGTSSTSWVLTNSLVQVDSNF